MEDTKYDFEVIGTCCMCGQAVIDTQDFTLTDGEFLLHDECK